MAIFSVEILDQDIDRVLNAISYNYGRQDQIQNPNFNLELEESIENPRLIENPESKAAFANRKVRDFLKDNVIAYEKEMARRQLEESLNINIEINDPQL